MALRFAFPLMVGRSGWSFAVVAKSANGLMHGPSGDVALVQEPEKFVQDKGLADVLNHRPPELRTTYPHITQFSSSHFRRPPDWGQASDQLATLLALLQKSPALSPCNPSRDEIILVSASVAFGPKDHYFHGATVGPVGDHAGAEDNELALAAKWRAVVDSPVRYKLLVLSEEDAQEFERLKIDPDAEVVALHRRQRLTGLMKQVDSQTRNSRRAVLQVPPTIVGMASLLQQCLVAEHYCEELPHVRETVSVSRAKIVAEHQSRTQKIVVPEAPVEHPLVPSAARASDPSDGEKEHQQPTVTVPKSTLIAGVSARPLESWLASDDEDGDHAFRREYELRAPSRLAENQEPTGLSPDPRDIRTQQVTRAALMSTRFTMPRAMSLPSVSDSGELSSPFHADPAEAVVLPEPNTITRDFPVAFVGWVILVAVGCSAIVGVARGWYRLERSQIENVSHKQEAEGRTERNAGPAAKVLPQPPEPSAARPFGPVVVPPVHVPVARRPTLPTIEIAGGLARVECSDEYQDVASLRAGVREVSGDEYMDCVRAGRCALYKDVIAVAKVPLRNVSLDEAREICAGFGLRLPTDAEWTLMAQAGPGALCNKALQRRYGGGTSCDLANVACAERPAVWETSSRAPQESPDWLVGLYGNVSEWSADGHVRGGNYDDTAIEAKPGVSRSLSALGAAERSPRVGLRCVE